MTKEVHTVAVLQVEPHIKTVTPSSTLLQSLKPQTLQEHDVEHVLLAPGCVYYTQPGASSDRDDGCGPGPHHLPGDTGGLTEPGRLCRLDSLMPWLSLRWHCHPGGIASKFHILVKL